MTIKAVGFKAVIKPDPVEETTKSGIVIMADKRMEANAQVRGTILDLGEDFAAAFKPKTPFWGLKVGDVVYYAKYAGKWIKDPKTDEEYLLVNDEDICAKYEETHDDSNIVETKET